MGFNSAFKGLIRHLSLLTLVAIVYSVGARDDYTTAAIFEIFVHYLQTSHGRGFDSRWCHCNFH